MTNGMEDYRDNGPRVLTAEEEKKQEKCAHKWENNISALYCRKCGKREWID